MHSNLKFIINAVLFGNAGISTQSFQVYKAGNEKIVPRS